jgi:hypothetical protein
VSPSREGGAIVSAGILLEQYEELRRAALGRGTREAPGRGLVVLLRQGMTAWMRTWSDQARPSADRPQAEQRTDAEAEERPCGVPTEVVSVLAGMVMAAAAAEGVG